MLLLESYAHLTEATLPAGRYTIPAFEAWLWSDAIAPELDPHRTPLSLAYLVAMRSGAGSIEQLMALLDTGPEDGVLFGEIDLTFTRPIAVAVPYRVTARFTGVERKTGKRVGVLDRASFEHRIALEATGEEVAVIAQSWIVPRRSAA